VGFKCISGALRFSAISPSGKPEIVAKRPPT
jgi:hypothetical protein